MFKCARTFRQSVNMLLLPPKSYNIKKFHPSFGRLIANSATPARVWEDRIKLWLRRYEDIFGITKLTEIHNRVIEVQREMESVQDKRRQVQQDILNVQNRLQEVQAKLEKTSRGEDLYISIVTEEHELLKNQKRLNALLEVYDRTEREKQTALAIAISNSQDHERTYREKTKYLSLITGVVGGLIGVFGSSFNNWRHKKDIKYFADEIHTLIQNQNDVIYQHAGTQEKNQELQSEISSFDLENISNDLSKLIENMSEHFENTLDSKIAMHTHTTIAAFCGSLMMLSLLLYIFSSK